MKVSKNFILQEYVPQEIYRLYGDKSIWFVSEWQIFTMQFLRDRYSRAIRINDWYFGGKLHNRGTRSPMSKVGAPWSQHKMKAAVDFDIEGMTPMEIFEDISKSQVSRYIGAIEDPAFTPTWTHIDNRRSDKMIVVKPRKIKPLLYAYEDPEYYDPITSVSGLSRSRE